MTVAHATPDLEQADRSDRAFLGHPKGLGYLASAVFGLVAFVVFKIVLGKRMTAGPREQAAALS